MNAILVEAWHGAMQRSGLTETATVFTRGPAHASHLGDLLAGAGLTGRMIAGKPA